MDKGKLVPPPPPPNHPPAKIPATPLNLKKKSTPEFKKEKEKISLQNSAKIMKSDKK